MSSKKFTCPHCGGESIKVILGEIYFSFSRIIKSYQGFCTCCHARGPESESEKVALKSFCQKKGFKFVPIGHKKQ